MRLKIKVSGRGIVSRSSKPKADISVKDSGLGEKYEDINVKITRPQIFSLLGDEKDYRPKTKLYKEDLIDLLVGDKDLEKKYQSPLKVGQIVKRRTPEEIKRDNEKKQERKELRLMKKEEKEMKKPKKPPPKKEESKKPSTKAKKTGRFIEPPTPKKEEVEDERMIEDETALDWIDYLEKNFTPQKNKKPSNVTNESIKELVEFIKTTKNNKLINLYEDLKPKILEKAFKNIDEENKREKKEEPKKPPPKKEEPKKPPPKKEEPKKPPPKKEEPKKPPPKKELKIKKPTAETFIPNFQKLPKNEQMQVLIKQSDYNFIDKKDYRDKAEEFYNELPSILNKSASRALDIMVNKYGFSADDLSTLYKGKTYDFYPTPNEVVEYAIGKLPSATKRDKTLAVLEPSAGIGNVAYQFYKKGYKNIWANERDEGLYKIMEKLLPKQIKVTNNDFFDIPLSSFKNVELMFVNPPFEKFIWVKFLLRSIQILNKSKEKGLKDLLFVSPQINQNKNDDYSLYWGNMVKGDEGGLIPKKAFIKYVEEILETELDEDRIEDIFEGEDEEFEENFGLFYGSQQKAFTGFGGTGIKAYVYTFQTE